MNKLRQTLTLSDLTLIAIGSTIGSGIFKTPSKIAAQLPSGFWMMLIWGVGGIIALTGALTYAELGSAYPGSGGIYRFLREGYGKLTAFLYGWAILLVINTGSMAALATVFADYLSYLLKESPWQIEAGDGGRMGIAIGGIAFLTLVNLQGAKWASRFSGMFTFLKMAGIVLLIGAGFLAGKVALGEMPPAAPAAWNGNLLSALGAALVGVLWSYGGWQHASYISAEAIHPTRTVPRAMILGAAVVTLLYMLCNIAYLKMLPLDGIAGNKVVASAALQTVIGPAGGILIACVIFISTFGTTSIYTLTAPRIYHAMAEDKVFFEKLSEVNERTGVPAFAVVIQSVWAIVLVFLWKRFEQIIDYVTFVEWIFLTLAGASVFIYRMRIRKAGKSHEGFRVPLYPVVPGIFVIVCSWFVVNQFIINLHLALVGCGLVLAGIPVYLLWNRK